MALKQIGLVGLCWLLCITAQNLQEVCLQGSACSKKNTEPSAFVQTRTAAGKSTKMENDEEALLQQDPSDEPKYATLGRDDIVKTSKGRAFKEEGSEDMAEDQKNEIALAAQGDGKDEAKTECAKIPKAAISGHNKKHLTGQTVESCTQACFGESWCKSFDWYKYKKACDLSDKSAADVGGLKFNYRGNPYDHYACESIASFTTMSTIPKAAISGHNTKHLEGQTVGSCSGACLTESWCKSFDWYKHKNACDLSDKSASDVGGLKFRLKDYDHYPVTRGNAIPECAKIPKAAISGHNKKHLTGQTVESCTRACFGESWCESFDWYKYKKACDLSDKSAADVGGLKYWYRGNPYDHYACESAESALSVSTKSTIPNAAISGYNNEHLTGQTVEGCSLACLRQSWCKSFDWYKHKKACDLSDKSASDVGGLKYWYRGNPYDHYPVVREDS